MDTTSHTISDLSPKRLSFVLKKAGSYLNPSEVLTKRPCDSVKSRVKAIKKCMPEKDFTEFFPKRYSYGSDHYDPWVYGLVTLGSAEQMERLHYARNPGTKSGIFQHAYQRSFNSDPERSEGERNSLFNGLCLNRAHEMLSKVNYPTYFIDKPMFDVLERTGVSRDLRLEDVEFPIPSMVVMPPKGEFYTTDGERRLPEHKDKYGNNGGTSLDGIEVCALSITKTLEFKSGTSRDGIPEPDFRLDVGDTVSSGLANKPWSQIPEGEDLTEWNVTKDKLESVLYIVGALDGGEYVVGRYPLSGMTLGDLIDQSNRIPVVDDKQKKFYEKVKREQGEDALKEIHNNDFNGMSRLIEFTGKLICFMSSKPEEWVDKSEVIRPQRIKKGKVKQEAIWSANFIGRSYAQSLADRGYGKDKSDGEGGVLRYHWRKGHFRGQRYGKNRSKYKTVFIEPYPVNPEDK